MTGWYPAVLHGGAPTSFQGMGVELAVFKMSISRLYISPFDRASVIIQNLVLLRETRTEDISVMVKDSDKVGRIEFVDSNDLC